MIEGKLVVDDYGNEQTITISKCLQAQTLTTCQKCTGDQVIFNNTCQYYIDIAEDQRIGECKIIQSGTPPVCLQCKDNTYLNANNCCSYGFFFNGTKCLTLATISLNCGTWLNGACASCLPENGNPTYLSNKLACCQDGSYATSSVMCKPIVVLKNCLQTDNEVQCNKCAPGYQSVNGLCQPITIANCSIGKDSVCVLCSTGFYFDAVTKTCLAQPTIPNCTTMKVNSPECDVCATGKYWDGYSCCNNETVSMVTGFPPALIVCTALNVYDANCFKVRNDSCIECINGYKVSNNVCCAPGQYPNAAGVCTAVTGNGLTKCK